MGPEAISKVIDLVDVDTYFMLFKWFLVGFLFLWSKGFIERLVGYVYFKQNEYVSIGSPVRVDGIDGNIQSVKVSSILIETNDGVLFIDTAKWRTRKWEFLTKREKMCKET